jgi:ATP/maltotriose-dependent transcriptional regulator MalT
MGIRTVAAGSVTAMPFDCLPGTGTTRGAKGPLTTASSRASATPVLAATKLHIPALRPGHDPVRFWDGVFAAVQTIAPHVGGSAQAALHSPGTTVTDQVLPLLINDLAELAEPVVIVLDDYHLIDNRELHGAIELLVHRLPLAAELVISTRSDPPLPLSRLRARGQLTEIRGADLRFNVSEAGIFLNDVVGLDLDPYEIARLHERTEGWAAGLQLAGLSLRGREDYRQFIDSFAGDDQQIVDYLGFEVLDRQPPELREFMIQSSVLGLSLHWHGEREDASRTLTEAVRIARAGVRIPAA